MEKEGYCMIIERWKAFWKKQDTLEKSIFWMILAAVFLSALVSTIFTIAEQQGVYASIASAGGCVVSLLLGIVARKTSMINQCYLALCYLLCCFLFPLLFFFCGGFKSGMPLYCFAVLTLCAFAHSSRAKWMTFSICLVAVVLTFVISWLHPEYVLQISDEAMVLDASVSFVIVAIGIFAVVSYALNAYDEERKKREKLVTQLDFLSKRDSMTGLYNRPYLIRYLENMVWMRREQFFVMMFDVDDIRQVNNSFGHAFGDKVLMSIAGLLKRTEDEEAGECAARYGGEEFIYVIHAASEIEAYAKADRFRERVSNLSWEEFPQVRVTISGGIVPCHGEDVYDHKQILSQVDDLLYRAKTRGKNQIRSISG